MWDTVGNPEDRFSHNEAHLISEVQISMSHVGICGTDVHFWQHMAIGNFVVSEPTVLGHEGAGVISQVGEGVTNLKVGK